MGKDWVVCYVRGVVCMCVCVGGGGGNHIVKMPCIIVNIPYKNQNDNII